jgi:hypothetical protein
MAEKSGATRHDREIEEFLRLGGRKIPAGFAAKARAATKARLLKKLDSENHLRTEAAELYGELKGGAPLAVDDPANRKTLDAILRMHRKVAHKKLAFPRVVPGGGQAPASFSGTAIPPFDFAQPSVGGFFPFEGPTGNPVMSAVANKNGQISASVVTSETVLSEATEWAEVGIYFHPPGYGMLTISANPRFSFEWLTNSLNRSLIGASGLLELTIQGVNAHGNYPPGSEESQSIFNESGEGIHFGFKFDVQTSLSASIEVDPTFQYYSCTVSVTAGALALGWPRSLAIAMLSATVPWISYAFTEEFAPPGS